MKSIQLLGLLVCAVLTGCCTNRESTAASHDAETTPLAWSDAAISGPNASVSNANPLGIGGGTGMTR